MDDNTRSLLGRGPLRKAFGGPTKPQTDTEDIESVTIGELKDEYGEQAVLRGIKYMASLSDADRSYRDSPDKDRYIEETQNAYGISSDEPNDMITSASEEWEENMRNNGLGLDDN